ncbi:leucine carboxyl, partial [Cystoisospora suis]
MPPALGPPPSSSPTPNSVSPAQDPRGSASTSPSSSSSSHPSSSSPPFQHPAPFFNSAYFLQGNPSAHPPPQGAVFPNGHNMTQLPANPSSSISSSPFPGAPSSSHSSLSQMHASSLPQNTPACASVGGLRSSHPSMMTGGRGGLNGHSLFDGGPPGQPEELPPLCLYSSEDAALQATTDDAASSKLSSVLLRYYKDDFLPHFVKKRTRRAPLINRGYYSRVAAVRLLLSAFVSDVCSYTERRQNSSSSSSTTSSQVASLAREIFKHAAGGGETQQEDSSSYPIDNPLIQFVNLGAGMDTLFFWLNERYRNIKVFEVDFRDVVACKQSIIQQNADLWRTMASSVENLHPRGSEFINTDKYTLVPADLRDVNNLSTSLQRLGFRDDVPTLFLSECVLVYMQTSDADAVLRWAAQAVKTAPSVAVVYEQLNPNDAFGRTMVRNLQTRGCPLLTIFDYPTLESQRQ